MMTILGDHPAVGEAPQSVIDVRMAHARHLRQARSGRARATRQQFKHRAPARISQQGQEAPRPIENLRPHLKDVKPAVMTVGGWFDAENLFGALECYKAIERNSPNATNRHKVPTAEAIPGSAIGNSSGRASSPSQTSCCRAPWPTVSATVSPMEAR